MEWNGMEEKQHIPTRPYHHIISLPYYHIRNGQHIIRMIAEAEENYVKEAIWRCFLASLGRMTLDLESPIWSQVAAFSDAHPELYAFPTTESAWDTLDEMITKLNDPVAIQGWRSNARTVTQRMLNAADDLILRVHNLRSVHHWRAMVGVGPALQLARKPIPFEPCDLELRNFAAVLRALPQTRSLSTQKFGPGVTFGIASGYVP
jgi:hypothetical protein